MGGVDENDEATAAGSSFSSSLTPSYGGACWYLSVMRSRRKARQQSLKRSVVAPCAGHPPSGSSRLPVAVWEHWCACVWDAG